MLFGFPLDKMRAESSYRSRQSWWWIKATELKLWELIVEHQLGLVKFRCTLFSFLISQNSTAACWVISLIQVISSMRILIKTLPWPRTSGHILILYLIFFAVERASINLCNHYSSVIFYPKITGLLRVPRISHSLYHHPTPAPTHRR